MLAEPSLPQAPRQVNRLLLFAAVLLGSSCGSPTDAPQDEKWTLTPTRDRLEFTSLGDTATVGVRGSTRTKSDWELGARWASSSPDVVSVDSLSGRATALREGTAVLTGKTQWGSVTVSASVSQRAVSWRVIQAPPDTAFVGAAIPPIELVALDAGGSGAMSFSRSVTIRVRTVGGGRAAKADGSTVQARDGLVRIDGLVIDEPGLYAIDVLMPDGGRQATFVVEIPVRLVAIDSYHDVCGLDAEGHLWCWSTPGAFKIAPERKFKSVSVGFSQVCAIALENGAYCWTKGPALDQVVMAPLEGGEDFVFVSMGSGTSCGVDVAGQGHCWGRNDFGELGNLDHPRSTPAIAPVPVQGGLSWEKIESQGQWTCGLSSTHEIYCWGLVFGLSWTGTPKLRKPTPTYTDVDSGRSTCILDVGGHGQCSEWSREGFWDILGGHTWDDLESGWHHFAGLTPAGRVWVWGQGDGGQLGQGDRSPSEAPVEVPPIGDRWLAVSAGTDNTCALSGMGVPYCWGRDIGLLSRKAPQRDALRPGRLAPPVG